MQLALGFEAMEVSKAKQIMYYLRRGMAPIKVAAKVGVSSTYVGIVRRRYASGNHLSPADLRYREANAEKLREENRERVRRWRHQNPERWREIKARSRRACAKREAAE